MKTDDVVIHRVTIEHREFVILEWPIFDLRERMIKNHIAVWDWLDVRCERELGVKRDETGLLYIAMPAPLYHAPYCIELYIQDVRSRLGLSVKDLKETLIGYDWAKNLALGDDTHEKLPDGAILIKRVPNEIWADYLRWRETAYEK